MNFQWHNSQTVPSSGAFGVFVGREIYSLIITNIQLSAPGYDRYYGLWRGAKKNGLLDNVRTFNPATGDSWVTGQLGRVTPEILRGIHDRA